MDYSLPGSSVMGFSRRKYWGGLPFPSPGDSPDPGIEPWSPVLQAVSLSYEPSWKPNKKDRCVVFMIGKFDVLRR